MALCVRQQLGVLAVCTGRERTHADLSAVRRGWGPSHNAGTPALPTLHPCLLVTATPGPRKAVPRAPRPVVLLSQTDQGSMKGHAPEHLPAMTMHSKISSGTFFIWVSGGSGEMRRGGTEVGWSWQGGVVSLHSTALGEAILPPATSCS